MCAHNWFNRIYVLYDYAHKVDINIHLGISRAQHRTVWKRATVATSSQSIDFTQLESPTIRKTPQLDSGSKLNR